MILPRAVRFSAYFFTGQQQDGISSPVSGHMIVPTACADLAACCGTGAGAGFCGAFVTGTHDKAIRTGRVANMVLLQSPSIPVSDDRAEGIA